MIEVRLLPPGEDVLNEHRVSRGTVPIKKIFPDMSKRVEPHVDEEQGVEYDKDGDTIIL